MVTTRNNTTTDDAPTSPPPTTKRVTRTSNGTSSRTSSLRSAKSPSRDSLPPPSTRASSTSWSHTPSNLTLIWLAISLPLVIWDTGYVLLRPHSMPGGKFHKPIWSPYELYGTVDYVYGFKALEANNGWTSAQGSINALETMAYGVYLWIVYQYGVKDTGVQGRGAPDKSVMGVLRGLSQSRTLSGKYATYAALLAYSTASLTFWKTVLYWLLEAFGGFHNIGHNDLTSLVFLWIIPNGLWIVFPLYMMYVFGQEILQGLEVAAAMPKRKYKSAD